MQTAKTGANFPTGTPAKNERKMSEKLPKNYRQMSALKLASFENYS
jgi:hypothetical protein